MPRWRRHDRGASLVPVAPAFEAASNALKGHEAYALKGASSRNAARVRLRAALESAVKSKAADLDERPSHASPVAKFVPTRERSVRNGFCRDAKSDDPSGKKLPCPSYRFRTCAPGEGWATIVPGARLWSAPWAVRGGPGSGWQSERREEG